MANQDIDQLQLAIVQMEADGVSSTADSSLLEQAKKMLQFLKLSRGLYGISQFQSNSVSTPVLQINICVTVSLSKLTNSHFDFKSVWFY